MGKRQISPYEWVRWAMRVEIPDNTPAKRLTLVTLATFANANGECFPAQATIAKRVGGAMSEKSVQRALSDFEGAGILARVSRYREDGSGGRRSNFYVLAATIRADRQVICTLERSLLDWAKRSEGEESADSE